MYKKLLAAGVLALTLATQSAWADTKIGVVNPERILRESQAALEAQQKLEKEFASREKSLSISAKALKADVEKYQKAAQKMSKTERIATERKLADQERQCKPKNLTAHFSGGHVDRSGSFHLDSPQKTKITQTP